MNRVRPANEPHAVFGKDRHIVSDYASALGALAAGRIWNYSEGSSTSQSLIRAEDVKIEHTKQKDMAWFYGTIFGAPLLVLGGGLVYAQRVRRSCLPG